MQRSDATPVRLAVLSLVGTLIGVVGLIAVTPHRNVHGVWSFWGSLIAFIVVPLAICCSGFYVSIRAQHRLKDGIDVDRWTDAELKPLRSLFERLPIRLAPWVIVGAGLVMLLIESSHPHRGFSLGFWICFLFGNALMGLKHSLAEPEQSQPSSWLHSSVPLQSKHWGDRL